MQTNQVNSAYSVSPKHYDGNLTLGNDSVSPSCKNYTSGGVNSGSRSKGTHGNEYKRFLEKQKMIMQMQDGNTSSNQKKARKYESGSRRESKTQMRLNATLDSSKGLLNKSGLSLPQSTKNTTAGSIGANLKHGGATSSNASSAVKVQIPTDDMATYKKPKNKLDASNMFAFEEDVRPTTTHGYSSRKKTNTNGSLCKTMNTMENSNESISTAASRKKDDIPRRAQTAKNATSEGKTFVFTSQNANAGGSSSSNRADTKRSERGSSNGSVEPQQRNHKLSRKLLIQAETLDVSEGVDEKELHINQPAGFTTTSNKVLLEKKKRGDTVSAEPRGGRTEHQTEGDSKGRSSTVSRSTEISFFTDQPLGNLDDYLIGKQIGQGAYAVVRFAIHKPTNKKVAIKTYDKFKLLDPQRKKSVRREIKLMQKLNHPHIIKLFEAIDMPRQVHLVMEYVGGHSLHSYLKSKPNRRMDDAEARRIMKQLISGLHYCHSKSVSHRDIKLENLLLDSNGNVKIIDFGFSTCIPNDKKVKIFCGTPSYMAPEIVAKKEYCGPPVDIWASGVLLFALLNGCFPFRGQNDKDLYRKILRGVFVIPDHVSSEARALITQTLNVDATKRPTAKQFYYSPWMQAKSESQSSRSDMSTATTAVTNSNETIPSENHQRTPKSSNGAIKKPQLDPDVFNCYYATNSPKGTPGGSGYHHGTGGSSQATPKGKSPSNAGSFGASSSGNTPTNHANININIKNANVKFAFVNNNSGPNNFNYYYYVNNGSSSGTPQAAASGSGSGTSNGWVRTQDSSQGSSPHHTRGGKNYQETLVVQTVETEEGQNCTVLFDQDIINSILRLGYSQSEIYKQLKTQSSHISILYHRLLEDKKLSSGNQTVQPAFVPSIMTSFAATGYTNTNGMYTTTTNGSNYSHSASPKSRLNSSGAWGTPSNGRKKIVEGCSDTNEG